MAVKPELSLHMMSRLLLHFTQHVRDCFHFTAIVKGWFLALQSQAFPKWLAVVAGMPEVVMCHNTQGLWTPGREGLCTSVSETTGGEWFAGGEMQHRHFVFGTENQRLQQQNEASLKGIKEQPPEWVRFIPPLGQGLFSSKSRWCMFSAFPSSSSSFILFPFPLRKNPLNSYKNPQSTKSS